MKAIKSILMYLERLSSLVFFVTLLGCSGTKDVNDSQTIDLVPVSSLAENTIKPDSSYYTSRFLNVLKLPWLEKSYNSEGCVTVMLIQLNGCNLCTERTFKVVQTAIPKSKKGFVVATVGTENDLLELKNKVGSNDIAYHFITVADSKKYGLDLKENYDLRFCQGNLIAYKGIE